MTANTPNRDSKGKFTKATFKVGDKVRSGNNPEIGIITIQAARIAGDEVNAVNGKDLHAFLEVGTMFKDWMTRRIEEYGFLEGRDFCSFLSESTGGRPSKEYMLSLDMAKELAMVERNAKGKEARAYFIECERKSLAPQNPILTMSRLDLLKLAVASEEANQALSCQVQEMTPKAEFHDRVAEAKDGQSIGEVAKVLGTGQNRLFQWLRGKRILMADNLPYQEHIDACRFVVIENIIPTNTHGNLVKPQTLITGKGQTYIQRRWESAKLGGVTA